eukprot:Platyproteum_vivax@DN4859_c0_g1_i2.p1
MLHLFSFAFLGFLAYIRIIVANPLDGLATVCGREEATDVCFQHADSEFLITKKDDQQFEGLLSVRFIPFDIKYSSNNTDARTLECGKFTEAPSVGTRSFGQFSGSCVEDGSPI